MRYMHKATVQQTVKGLGGGGDQSDLFGAD